MTDKPLISVVVPAFNSLRFLESAIKSIVAQEYEPLEIIVVDDGSSDGTPDVALKLDQVTIYIRQRNQGPAATRNLGIKVSRGEFIGFLDADDLWHPEKLKRQLAAFEANPSMDYCLSFVQSFWEAEVSTEGQLLRDHPRARPIPGYATGPLLARRSAFDRVGMLNEELWSTDAADWFMRAENAGLTMEMLPEVLVFRRFHGSNMTKRLSEPFKEEWLRMIKAKLDSGRTDATS